VQGKEDRNVLSLVEPEDLIKYGMIPEFVGRLRSLHSLMNLMRVRW